MTQITPETYDALLEGTVAAAERTLAAFWKKIEGLPAIEKRIALEGFWPALIAQYGDEAAAIAADRFEDVTGLPAVMPETYDPEYLNGRMRWAIDPVFSSEPDTESAFELLSNLIDEIIFDAGRATTEASAEEHNLRVARAPSAGACAWCVMLGSRGYDYVSKSSATAASHNHCRCRLVVEGEDAGDYDPEALLEIYTRAADEADSRSPKDILAKMREQGDVGDKHKPKKPSSTPDRSKSKKSSVTPYRPKSSPGSYSIREDWSRWKAANGKPSGKWDPDNPLASHFLQIEGTGAPALESLAWLEAMPRWYHETLADFGTRIYVGDKTVPYLDDMGHLVNMTPRGWAKGQTWNEAGGAYSSSDKKLLIGFDSPNRPPGYMAMHEGGHAIDHAIGKFSERSQFRKAARSIRHRRPYFSAKTNPGGWASETFAQGFGYFMRARASGEDVEEAVAVALGSRSRPATGVKGIIHEFEKIATELEAKYGA